MILNILKELDDTKKDYVIEELKKLIQNIKSINHIVF